MLRPEPFSVVGVIGLKCNKTRLIQWVFSRTTFQMLLQVDSITFAQIMWRKQCFRKMKHISFSFLLFIAVVISMVVLLYLSASTHLVRWYFHSSNINFQYKLPLIWTKMCAFVSAYTNYSNVSAHFLLFLCPFYYSFSNTTNYIHSVFISYSKAQMGVRRMKKCGKKLDEKLIFLLLNTFGVQ